MARIRIWDGALRLFHWLLVLIFAASVFSAFQDKSGIWGLVHLYAGYGIIGLLFWRCAWGLWGSENVRLSRIAHDARMAGSYLNTLAADKPYPYSGHNPLGSFSVLLMLGLLALQVTLGLFASEEEGFTAYAGGFAGPFAEIGDSLGLPVSALHEIVGYLLMLVVAIHILAVFLYRFWLHVDVLTPMISGWRDADEDINPPRLASKRRAALCALGAAGLVLALIVLAS